MVEKKGLTAYITYPATPQVRSVLLREERHTMYKVLMNGKPVSNEFLKIPAKVINDMKQRREISLLTTTIPISAGITNVFGVTGSVTSVLRGTGNIRIRVTGETFDKLMLNIITIKSEMYKYFKETPKMCIWGKELALDADDGDKPAKKSLDFDMTEVRKRREAEIRSIRQK